MIESEVLIIGAGPAGSILARELSLANMPNILIQRNFDFKKPCGGGIRVDAFSEFDIDTKLIKHHINAITLVHKSTRVEVDITENPLAIVHRVEFDSALREMAKNAGTELYEATFVDVEIYDEYLISTVKIKGETKKIKSKYLVGADGVNSKVRRVVNRDRVSHLMTNYADLVEFSVPKSCEFHFGADISDKYYAWAFPESGGTNIGTLANEKKPYMDNFAKSINVKEKFKAFGYKIPEFDNTIFYKNRVFFVGDSASQVLPFTYEGIYYAMSSAKILSSVFIEKCAPSEYEKRWNAVHLSKFNTLKKLQKIFLYNDFMISLMMKLYASKKIQKRVINLWLKDEQIKINLAFFYKLLKKALS
jgi:geranylgeranyl reductase